MKNLILIVGPVNVYRRLKKAASGDNRGLRLDDWRHVTIVESGQLLNDAITVLFVCDKLSSPANELTTLVKWTKETRRSCLVVGTPPIEQMGALGIPEDQKNIEWLGRMPQAKGQWDYSVKKWLGELRRILDGADLNPHIDSVTQWLNNSGDSAPLAPWRNQWNKAANNTNPDVGHEKTNHKDLRQFLNALRGDVVHSIQAMRGDAPNVQADFDTSASVAWQCVWCIYRTMNSDTQLSFECPLRPTNANVSINQGVLILLLIDCLYRIVSYRQAFSEDDAKLETRREKIILKFPKTRPEEHFLDIPGLSMILKHFSLHVDIAPKDVPVQINLYLSNR